MAEARLQSEQFLAEREADERDAALLRPWTRQAARPTPRS